MSIVEDVECKYFLPHHKREKMEIKEKQKWFMKSDSLDGIIYCDITFKKRVLIKKKYVYEHEIRRIFDNLIVDFSLLDDDLIDYEEEEEENAERKDENDDDDCVTDEEGCVSAIPNFVRDKLEPEDLKKICVFCDNKCGPRKMGCRLCGFMFHPTCWMDFSEFLSTRVMICPICIPNYEPIYGCPFDCLPKISTSLEVFRSKDIIHEKYECISLKPAKKRRKVVDTVKKHIKKEHKVLHCKKCDTKVFQHMIKSHRARKCGNYECKCPVSDCKAMIDMKLYGDVISDPKVLLDSYHKCEHIVSCLTCNKYFLSFEDLDDHLSECPQTIDPQSIQIQKRKKRKAFGHAKSILGTARYNKDIIDNDEEEISDYEECVDDDDDDDSEEYSISDSDA